MNYVPVIFYEQLASQFCLKKTLIAGSALPGQPGRILSNAYGKRCLRYIWVRNGQFEDEKVYNEKTVRHEAVSTSGKHLHFTVISIRAGEEEYITDLEAMERVLSVTKGKHVRLCLRTPNISEEIAKCVESIRFVFDLQVDTKITSDVLKVVRSCVEKNTLNIMDYATDVEMEAETAQLLVDLLKQKQFHRIFLPAKWSAALKTIIACWKKNSEEMVGKRIACTEELSEFQLSSTEFPFEECTQEDERDAKLAYPFAGHWPYITRKLVIRNRDGKAVYCFSRPSFEFKSVFVFA